MRYLPLFIMLALAVTACAQTPRPKDEVASFTLKEAFGVQHPDQIVAFDLSAPVDPAKSYLLGPAGAEVPYQVLGGGKQLAVRTNLPASRMALRRGLSFTCEQWAKNYKFDTAGMEKHLTTDGPFFTPGDAVQVDGSRLPTGLARDTNYYVTRLEFREVNGWGFYFIGLSATPGGPSIPMTDWGESAGIISQGLVADPETDLLYAHAHGLIEGTPVVFRTNGELPQPLKAGTAYYVCKTTADRFGVSEARGGKPIDLTAPGKGLHLVLIEWAWTLKTGRAPKFTPEVKAAQQDNLWEVTNDRLGVRIPATQVPADPQKAPAPVQGVRLADGRWTGAGITPITFTPGTQVKKLTTTLVENGPLKVVAELVYELDRAQYNYGSTVVCPAGPGKYTCRIEVQAGQPSVLFEEDTECTFSYNIDLKGLTLNQARYRGHSVRDAKHGYRPDGKAVTSQSTDAFFDLPFDKNYASGYVTALGSGLIRWMNPWDPWMFDSGSYWMLYDQDGGDASPLIGFYDGRASRLRRAGAVGVGVYTKAPASGGPSAGITVQAWQRGPDARIHPDPRWQWRLFVGRKGPDMRDWREIQPINLQMNLHSGIGLNKIANLTFDFKEPAAGYGAMYMTKEAATDMVRRLREDDGFYRAAYNSVTYYRDLLDMIRDKTGNRVHLMAYDLWRGAHDGLNTLVNRGGIMGSHGFGYWHAGLEGSRALLRIDQVLASDLATEEDKALARQTAVFYGAALWDDDHAPLTGIAGVNLGTANMPVQQQGYRDMYALYLSSHPMMKGRTEGVLDRALRMVRGTINEHGAHMGCTHYIGAANGPLLSTLQQLKQAGIANVFKDEPRLKKYAEFEMNFSTPVDPRFGRRVRPSIGDSCPGEATEFLGMLATAYADLDPVLSRRLMGMWKQCGKPHSDFHGATTFKIDERLPEADPRLTSYHAEGWYSALRFGWGTPNETVAWFVNGGFYSDHASNDLGEAIIYALGAPLSLDFGTMYSPHSGGGFVHSVVLPETSIGDWKQNPPDVSKGPRWGKPTTLDYQANDRAAWSKAGFTMKDAAWTRTVKVAMLKDDLPAIGIRDEFTTQESRVFLLNLMNDGSIVAPDGAKNVGDSFTIPAGITKLHYTGQAFVKHPAGGIDWDLYIIADAPQEAFIARYAHKNVMPETQSILRLKGTGGFQVVIVPYFKGLPAPNVAVGGAFGKVIVSSGGVSVGF
ncbi:MAG: hypothetical protein ACYC7E_12145 [Armatimonadota bacterium]